MGRLEGKIAIVTGAASGIGEACAKVMASEGARVCVSDLNLEGAQLVAKEIRENGGEAFALRVDVSSPEQNTELVEETVSTYGGLHIAHLNAGTGAVGSVIDLSLEDWDRTMAVNLRGVFLGLQAAARAMVRGDGGSIVITSSAAGTGGVAMASPYSASKHGVIGLAKSAALDLAADGVRVNAVCPGVIETPPLRAMAERLVRRNKLPLGRAGTGDDVAHLVAFLASDEASYITGSVYSIDGGTGAGTNVVRSSASRDKEGTGQ
jgi:NAD(P)-dependent dehydrogenase (short-subunit alcohol dehydrogenase family)